MFKKKSIKTLAEFEQQPITNVFGSDLTLKGDINGDAPIRIDGTVDGNINVSKGIILGEKSKITGNIQTDYIVVYGKLQGNVTAKNLFIKSTGSINGDIKVEVIEIEVGGRYNGTLQMSADLQSALV